MTNAAQHRPAGNTGTFADPPGFRARRFRNWFFLGLLYAAFYLCRYNLGIVAPELKEYYGFTNEQYGRIASARDGGYAFGQFVNGLLADGLGGKQAMAVGAIGSILMNFAFGCATFSSIGWILAAFFLIRLLDGYFQAFGAPGMIKTSAAWFRRRERGFFSGIFGGVIQMGAVGAGALGKYLLVGFTVPLIGLTVARQDWRMMFFLPPMILFVILVISWLNVKNHPEEAGYQIRHDKEDTHAGEQRAPLARVFKQIAGNPLAWCNAGAYFCTGFVRRALEAWWVLYLVDAWHADKTSSYYIVLVWSLPLSAFVGSIGAGLMSDALFAGRRSPVAAALYGIETLCILAALLWLGVWHGGSPAIACIFLSLISLTCNSSHSIIGAAAAMDIGGQRMSGFACGVIDSFQYCGAILAGFLLGKLIDAFGWNALFVAMLPFSLLGALLMTGIWLRTRGRTVMGS